MKAIDYIYEFSQRDLLEICPTVIMVNEVEVSAE